MREIAPIHLERIKKSMSKAGRAPRSIQYMLASVRQVFNHAFTNGLFFGSNPAAGKGFKRPTVDNRRTCFLTKDEIAALLAELAKRSMDVHNMALFSLHTGERAGEFFHLLGGTDSFTGTALLRDTKSNKNRRLYLTSEVKKMFVRRMPIDAKNRSRFPRQERQQGCSDQQDFQPGCR